MRRILFCVSILLVLLLGPTSAFLPPPPPPTRPFHALLDDYTHQGQVLDPYRVLKISRDASTPQIKEAYRRLSRRYHPDGARHRGILPGSCNNEAEVRDEWEKIRRSYEILTKERRRFDRHVALADPGKALQRAAWDAAVGGVVGVGKGLWGLGTVAVKTVVDQSGKKEEDQLAAEEVPVTKEE